MTPKQWVRVWWGGAGCLVWFFAILFTLLSLSPAPPPVITHGDPAQMRAAASKATAAYDLCEPIKDAAQREFCRGHGPDPGPGPRTRAASEASASEASALSKISIADWSWSTGGFDLVMIADFNFKNDNPFPVKDLRVRCIHSASSGTEIDRNTRVIYEVVPAHGTKLVHQFNMGFIHSQAKSSRCSVIDYQMLDAWKVN
jgi:hypothetical protein